jgi:hypothetical protein
LAGCARSMTRRSAARWTINWRAGSVARRRRSGRSRSIDSRRGRGPRNLAEPGRQRLPRSRENLSRPGRRRTWFGRNRNPSRSGRGQRRGNRPRPRACRHRRTYRRNQRPCRSKTCGTFRAFLRGLIGSFGDRHRRGGLRRLQFGHALFRNRRFTLQDGDRGVLPPRSFFHCRFASQASPHQQDLIVFQRTGVRLLVGDAQIRKQLQNRAGLNFQFPSQLVDANFAHTLRLWRGIPFRARSLIFPDPSL